MNNTGQMASAFSHIVVPLSMGVPLRKRVGWRLLVLGMFLSAVPDADSLAFRFGVPYESQWGHRGFTHSIFFALICAFLIALRNDFFKSSRTTVFLFSFVSMASHGLLDALTNGGLGVAFFWPIDSTRFFLPWKVIEVSPLSPTQFFAEKWAGVLKSEIYYIWLPGLVVTIVIALLNKFYSRTSDSI